MPIDSQHSATPASGDPVSIAAIRDASRRIVRELGFMQPTLAGTALPPSAVHALIELGAHEADAHEADDGANSETNAGLTATDLAERLNLEKSSISRMLRKRIEAGEIAEAPSARDGRVKTLALTAKGKDAFAAIDAFGEGQVAAAFGHLNAGEQRTVAAGLALYARALGAVRAGEDAVPRHAPLAIISGYRPGVVGRIAEMHARHYAKTMDFGQIFESKVASGAADFVARLGSPRNGLWIALKDERIVGTVAIDGEDLGDGTAHLRWFVVDEASRGTGAGRRLLGEAVAFCDRVGFDRTALWTIRGLEAARHLYEDAGFVLAEEWAGDQWGREVREQKYLRQRP